MHCCPDYFFQRVIYCYVDLCFIATLHFYFEAHSSSRSYSDHVVSPDHPISNQSHWNITGIYYFSHMGGGGERVCMAKIAKHALENMLG